MGETGERGADFGECEALFFAPPRGDLFSGETACGGVDMLSNPCFKQWLDSVKHGRHGEALQRFLFFLFFVVPRLFYGKRSCAVPHG